MIRPSHSTCSLLAVALICFAGPQADCQHRSLIARSRRELQVARPYLHMDFDNPWGPIDCYFWRPDGRLLLLKHQPRTFAYRALLADPLHGRLHRLRAFNARCGNLVTSAPYATTAAYAETPAEPIYYEPDCDLSRDGKWLVWHYAPGPHHSSVLGAYIAKWYAGRLDGSRLIAYATAPDQILGYPEDASNIGAIPHWLGASHRWMVSTRDNGAYIRDLAHPGQGIAIQCFPIPPIGADIIGMTNQGRCIETNLDFNGYPWYQAVKLFTFDLHHARNKTTTHVIALPSPSEVYEVRLSSDGNRLAWLLITRHQTDSKKASLLREVGLWTSDLNGKRMHKIGSVTVRFPHELANSMQTGGPWPKSLRWTSDGRRISFVYHQAIWSVAAN